MQINGINSGATMAASEPPEPPPRNPERINASVHKLSESKLAKSLDSNVSALKEKTLNNNKPLKPLLSLDQSNNPAAATATLRTTVGISTTPTTSTTSSYYPSHKTIVTTTGNGVITTAGVTTTSLVSQKRPVSDLTPSGRESISSPLSSNGSNHTLTSPMTIDNQPQLQQQPARVAYLNKSDSDGQLMLQQQNDAQQAPMAVNDTMAAANGQQQLQTTGAALMNGSGMRAGPIQANTSNLIAANHLNAIQSATTVDKKNANDVYPVVKSMDTGIVNLSSSTNSYPTSNTLKQIMKSCSPSSKSSSSSSSSALFLLSTSNSNSCDGNRNINDDSKFNNFHSDIANKLREENERLNTEVLRLRKILENSPEGAVGGIELSDSNSIGDTLSNDESITSQQRVSRLESELRSVKNQLMNLRLEAKRLRSDKCELIAQVKQLCASLQDKELELREFIRNFQERVRETETNNAKMTGDRERERWQLLKQARDEAERSLSLAQQLNARDMQLQRLQDQLQEARRQLSGCMSDQESLLSFAPLTPPSATSGMMNQLGVGSSLAGPVVGGVRGADDSGRGNSNSLSAFSGSLSGGSGATAGDRNSCSNDSGLRNSSDRESTGGELNFSDGTCDNGPCITVDPDSISLVSSQNIYQFGTPKERSPTLSPSNLAAYSRSVEQLGSPVDSEGPGAITRKFASKTGTLGARNGRGGTWGSISRVFARSRNKNKALSADGASEYMDYSWSPLSEECYTEKLRLLREASQLPMERWRATQVLAWLEVALGMPQYSSRCAENVKSGKVLLELNDAELEAGLGVVHPMHRKKLRLAIEEQRRPELVRYPMITQLGHSWVATEWLPDIGLPQYAEPFVQSLVDARMLDTLSKKELEKFLGVTRKFHQASIVHGIHVLRIVKYDRQTLAMRRVQSETVDTDPIVWTNQRFIRWARSIDLGEYADNLKDSGVHGGLVVLEPSFSGDTMATALGIPPSKNIIRRHLSTEFDALILPARATLGQGIRSGCGIVPITGPGGLQHYATTDRRSSGSLRSSLSKAFRFNAKSYRSGDRSTLGNSTSPTPSYSSSEGCGGIYATIGSHYQSFHHHPPPTTAPPPPPSQQISGGNYGPPRHRVSAPPVGCTLNDTLDTNLSYEQHRRVKSISDIGLATNSSGSGTILDASDSFGGISGSSDSPV